MPQDLGMCLNCSVNKATTKQGTVPLCGRCAGEAKKAARGVKMEPKDKPKKLSATR